MRSGKTSDGGDGKLSLGLLQQYNQLEESSDPAGPSEVSDGKYMNKRMRLAAAMDSIYVNLLVISLVLLDVISIAYFELQALTRRCTVDVRLNSVLPPAVLLSLNAMLPRTPHRRRHTLVAVLQKLVEVT